MAFQWLQACLINEYFAIVLLRTIRQLVGYLSDQLPNSATFLRKNYVQLRIIFVLIRLSLKPKTVLQKLMTYELSNQTNHLL